MSGSLGDPEGVLIPTGDKMHPPSESLRSKRGVRFPDDINLQKKISS